MTDTKKMRYLFFVFLYHLGSRGMWKQLESSHQPAKQPQHKHSILLHREERGGNLGARLAGGGITPVQYYNLSTTACKSVCWQTNIETAAGSSKAFFFKIKRSNGGKIPVQFDVTFLISGADSATNGWWKSQPTYQGLKIWSCTHEKKMREFSIVFRMGRGETISF